MSDLGSTFVNGELNLSGRLGGMSTRAPVMYDDFDAVDGTKILGDITAIPPIPPRTAPTGQVWQGFGPGAGSAVITNGRMFSNGGNAYMFLPVASPITRQACTFSFTPVPNSSGDRTSATVVMLMLPSGFSNFTTTTKMLHLLVDADSWELTTSTTGPSGLTSGSLVGGLWKAPLTTDGNVYQVAMEIDWVNHAITVYGSDGSINTIIDNRVHNMQPLTVATPHAEDVISLNITPKGGSLTQLTYPVTSSDTVATIAANLAIAVNGALAVTKAVNGVTAEYSTGGVFNLFWFGSNTAPTVTTSITGPGATTTVTVGTATNAGVVVGGTGVAGDGTIAASDLGGVAYQFINVADFNNYYHSVSSGPNLSDRLASSGRAAPMGIVAPLYGNGGYTRRQPFSGITLAGGGNVWFRILTGQAYFLNPKQQWGWAVAGRMRFDATDGAANLNAWEFDCNAILAGTFFPLNTPILTSKQGLQMSGLTSGLIKMARLSMDPAIDIPSGLCALDLFVDSSHPTIISGEFEGYGTFNPAPIPGAVTLETTRPVVIGLTTGSTAPNPGDVVNLNVTPSGGALVVIQYTVPTSPTLNSVAIGLANAVNANGTLSAARITANVPLSGPSSSFSLNIPDPAPTTSGNVTGSGATTTIAVGAPATTIISFSNS